VLHFFTNTHSDYHKPSDDWEKIDAPGIEKVVTIVSDIAVAAANRRPQLTLVRNQGQPVRAGSAAGSGGYGAYLGSVPDFAPVERGVKLGGVTAGSPGEKAGLKAGDILVGLGTHDVADLQGMTDALRAYKPGEVVPVKVIRDGKTLTVDVTLGTRAAR
jgi:S1-C subfamily serine protease